MSEGLALGPYMARRLEWDSNLLPSRLKAPNVPLSYHAPRIIRKKNSYRKLARHES